MHSDGSEPLDERTEKMIEVARATYHVPPATPREAMWQAIASATPRSTAVTPIGSRRVVNPWWLAVAASVVLAAGIAIGRVSTSGDSKPSQTIASSKVLPRSTERPDSVSATYQLAAVQHLTQTEMFLTEFRDQKRSSRDRARLEPWARDLLSTTRLMLDSPVGEDARLRSLLEDLELVLAQIVQHSATSRPDDREMIERTLEQRAVLGKIRTTIPSGVVPAGT
jgi:hypothetical protein